MKTQNEILVVKSEHGFFDIWGTAKKENIKLISCRDNENGMNLIRSGLEENGTIYVFNQHETFYGINFLRSMVKALKGLSATIEILEFDSKENFPNKFRVTLNK